MANWLVSLLLHSLSVFVVTQILPSVHIQHVAIAVLVALVYGILKTLFRGILLFLSLPLIVLTLGLFWFVINAFLLWVTDVLIQGFEIDGFFNTLIASILISLIDTVLHYWVEEGTQP